MFKNKSELINWILPYLPLGAEMEYRDKQAILQYMDIDGDGIHEIFGLFRLNRKYYLFVLKDYMGHFVYYYPLPPEVKKKAVRELSISRETRAVYLFPVVRKEIGGNKWGYIDTKGKIVLPVHYDRAEDFQENDLAIVGLMDKSGVINASGYFIVKPKYDTINPFAEGRAVVNDSQGFKVIDESGKEITGKAYSIIVGEYKEGRIRAVKMDEHGEYLYGYLNKRGNEVIPLIYESASDFEKGKAIVKTKDGTFQLIDLTGKVIHSYPYAFVGNYGEGLLTFKESIEGKSGYIDEQGKTVIEPKFSLAESFIDGRAIVSLLENNRENYGVIDRNGKFVIKPNYNQILSLDEGRFAIGKEIDPKQPCRRSIYALADSDGHILTGFNFSMITKFEDGLASVTDEEHTYFIDKHGKRKEHLPMVSGSGWLSFEKTLIKGHIDDHLLYFNQTGELIWKQSTILPLNNQFSVVEYKYKPNKDYLVYFPQIEGMKNPESVNRTLKELAGVKPVPAHKPLESNYTGNYEVTYYKKDLLVIKITGYDYPFCAAHGMPMEKYAHINLETGSMYQLKDLFKPGSPYVKVISDLIQAQLKSNNQYSSYLLPNEYHGIRADQPFFISEAGLNIYFNPYEIAAYAAGFPTFTIPFEDLKDLINRESEFWKSFH
ncbi:WG repeat-containing protein [Bacillus sp. sid0103]|uniref:WG repeat-containing protein n=1 Tax=Bacillus sp. sid0103 TaxID=2856337 RepID=UPI00210C950D|nr:WG repeat-containing protein [Bacillus sp. sid0103]